MKTALKNHFICRGLRHTEHKLSQESTNAERFWKHLEPLQVALERYCRYSIQDRNAVEDVLQDAVATAFADFDLFAEGTNFRAWIFRYVNFEIRAEPQNAHQATHRTVGGARR